MQIPFLDLTRQHTEIEAELAAAHARVLKRGVFVLGREVAAFENEWASYCGVRGAVGVNSGTDALALALVASGAVRRGQGDEVITSPLSAAYTALAIINAGGVPVFADINPHTYTLDPQAIERAVTPRTRAVVPVHLYGQMADMDAISELSARHGLIIVEDSAQAHGARWRGRRAGAHGHASAFSFYPTKNLGACGDGGAVTSNDEAILERLKTLRQGGHADALAGDTAGLNSRLDELQAAMLRIKLKKLDEWNAQRRLGARYYNEALSDTLLQLPVMGDDDETHVHHLYVIQHPQRDLLRAHLAARGVETLIHYPFLLHQQPLFRHDGQTALPVAEEVAKRISLATAFSPIRRGRSARSSRSDSFLCPERSAATRASWRRGVVTGAAFPQSRWRKARSSSFFAGA